jgi:hypothetical protein
VPNHPPEILDKFVAFICKQVKTHILRKRLHRFQAVLMLHKRVYIGVVPESGYLVSLFLPVFDGIGSAVSAATVDQ